MTDIVALEGELMRMVETAADEAALEAVRVAALGKKGSISALLATLGRMSPEERKEKGPLINGLKEAVTAAVAARREALKRAALAQRLAGETIDVTLPTPDNPAYVGFLPNRLHAVPHIAARISVWAKDRAEAAMGLLAAARGGG